MPEVDLLRLKPSTYLLFHVQTATGLRSNSLEGPTLVCNFLVCVHNMTLLAQFCHLDLEFPQLVLWNLLRRAHRGHARRDGLCAPHLSSQLKFQRMKESVARSSGKQHSTPLSCT